MKNKLVNNLTIIFVLLCLSIIPCFALFSNSSLFTSGHDNVFHFSQIQDLYVAIKNNSFSTLISPKLW